MTAPQQRTISTAVSLEGVGVHTGVQARVRLNPADPDTGIRFRLVGAPGAPELPASLDLVTETELGTTLGAGEAKVRTVEHLMAALAGAQVDNVVVEVEGPELPILDGSFTGFADAIERAVPVEQNADARVLELSGPIHLDAGKGTAYVAAPADRLSVAATIDFAHPSVGRSYGSFVLDRPASFRQDIAPARTFGFADEGERLQARGFALGASVENTVVLDDESVVNGPLRFEDEFVRHKVGDLLGDLALIGGRLRASIVAERPSHRGNVAFARTIARHIRRSGEPALDITRIMEFLPHRYPMLLVDRILEYEAGKTIVGIKNVTINEPFFQGHFPGHPIMPGVLILEAMAQCGGLLMMDEVENPEDKVVYFMTIDGAKFRKPVTPGDQLVFEMEVLQFRRGVCKIAGKALVDGKTVAQAEFKASLQDR
ncbi:MAG: bifunctional UDP-3-O-[3-hydroxymyristoyl] N-acetylglucosamine deacetylase/3-hydroxyacyl-ACP dehydratase [Gemmatimonadota bacterium]